MSVSEKRTELYVGLFVFVGIVIMAVLVLQFGRLEDRIKSSYPLHLEFDDATGIFKGVDVRLGGIKIGSVTDRAHPDPQLKGVVVDVVIFSEFQVPRNAEFRIRTKGLMGDSYVGLEIPSPPAADHFKPGETVEGISGGDLAALTSSAEELSKKAEALLDKLNAAVADVRGGIDNFNSALAKFDENILDEDNLENIRVAISNFRETSEKLSAAGEKLGPVLDDAGNAARNANGAFESAREIIVQLEPVIADIESAAEGASTTIDEINRGNGLLNALINDAALREDFTALIANLRAHGVLRYKDTGPAPDESAAGAAREPAATAAPIEKKSWRPFNRQR